MLSAFHRMGYCHILFLTLRIDCHCQWITNPVFGSSCPNASVGHPTGIPLETCGNDVAHEPILDLLIASTLCDIYAHVCSVRAISDTARRLLRKNTRNDMRCVR